jgi:transcriptional regulator with XRE-family HTH domain
MTITEAFSQILKAFRKGQGMSQQQLALEANLDRTYISLLERGLRQPSISTLFQLAEALQTTPEKLVMETRFLVASPSTKAQPQKNPH